MHDMTRPLLAPSPVLTWLCPTAPVVVQADLMLALGVRFDDRVTGKLEAFATHARIVHIDVDPAEIHKNKHAHIPICAGVPGDRACVRCDTQPTHASISWFCRSQGVCLGDSAYKLLLCCLSTGQT
jgi:hypothetical protein